MGTAAPGAPAPRAFLQSRLDPGHRELHLSRPISLEGAGFTAWSTASCSPGAGPPGPREECAALGNHGAGTNVQGAGGRSLRPRDLDICPVAGAAPRPHAQQPAVAPQARGSIIKILLSSPWQPRGARIPSSASAHQPHVKCKCGR